MHRYIETTKKRVCLALLQVILDVIGRPAFPAPVSPAAAGPAPSSSLGVLLDSPAPIQKVLHFRFFYHALFD